MRTCYRRNAHAHSRDLVYKLFTGVKTIMAMEGQERKSVSLERLEQLLPVAYKKYKELVPAIELMIHCRSESIAQLNCVADTLEKRHRDGNVVRVVGSATGLAGTLTSAAGVALTPFTMGLGLFIVAGGASIAAAGSLTAAGSHVSEKLREKIDLEKLQQAIDMDKAQCETVKQLWKEFESYCDDAVNTIALADPAEETDIASIQSWTQVALGEVTHSVILIAETFESLMCDAKNVLNSEDGALLCEILQRMACNMISDPQKLLRSAVSRFRLSIIVAGTIAFTVILTLFLGNLYGLMTTIIDIRKGSPSQVAEDLRDKSIKLETELNRWLDAFGNPQPH